MLDIPYTVVSKSIVPVQWAILIIRYTCLSHIVVALPVLLSDPSGFF